MIAYHVTAGLQKISEMFNVSKTDFYGMMKKNCVVTVFLSIIIIDK